jgi:hypothetical protein
LARYMVRVLEHSEADVAGPVGEGDQVDAVRVAGTPHPVGLLGDDVGEDEPIRGVSATELRDDRVELLHGLLGRDPRVGVDVEDGRPDVGHVVGDGGFVGGGEVDGRYFFHGWNGSRR